MLKWIYSLPPLNTIATPLTPAQGMSLSYPNSRVHRVAAVKNFERKNGKYQRREGTQKSVLK
jgi:hypothetical protein